MSHVMSFVIGRDTGVTLFPDSARSFLYRYHIAVIEADHLITRYNLRHQYSLVTTQYEEDKNFTTFKSTFFEKPLRILFT